MKQQKATPELMERIKQCIEDIEFGQITIQINKAKDTVDILIEERERFPVKTRGKVLMQKKEMPGNVTALVEKAPYGE